MPQMIGYIVRHDGAVKGWLSYYIEQFQGGEYIGGEEREGWGTFRINDSDNQMVNFYPKHDDDEMYHPESIDAERLALDSLSVEIRSRHKIEPS